MKSRSVSSESGVAMHNPYMISSRNQADISLALNQVGKKTRPLLQIPLDVNFYTNSHNEKLVKIIHTNDGSYNMVVVSVNI